MNIVQHSKVRVSLAQGRQLHLAEPGHALRVPESGQVTPESVLQLGLAGVPGFLHRAQQIEGVYVAVLGLRVLGRLGCDTGLALVALGVGHIGHRKIMLVSAVAAVAIEVQAWD